MQPTPVDNLFNPNPSPRPQPLKLEFTAQTAKVAQKSGYKLTSFATTHSLEFAEPPKRRIEAPAPHLQFGKPSQNSSNATVDPFTRAMAEADSFLNMGHIGDAHHIASLMSTSSSPPEPPQPTGSIQTHSSPTQLRFPIQHKLNFNPHSPPSLPTQEEHSTMPSEPPPTDLKSDKHDQPFKIKTEKEEPAQHFELLYQPNEKQRKSYKNENRYILPNPLTVVLNKQMKDKRVKVEKGSVTVSLLYDTGEELEDNREHILDGVKTRSLDKEKKAQFHLKVVETSDRNRFRLQFVVKFFINKVEHVEKIISHCFRVTSNKKCASIEKPRPFAIKPCFGPTHSETEVWIRGKLFTDRANTSVTFGTKEARVIETEDNILVCYAPVRDDLSDDTTVDVKITNHKGDQTESLDASKMLEFTYIIDRKRKRLKDEAKSDAPVPKEQATENSVLYCPPSPASTYPQLDDIVKNESEMIERLGYFFPSYFPMEAN